MVYIINNTMQIVTTELLTYGVIVDIFPSHAFSWPIEGLTHSDSEFSPILFNCHRARRMFQYVSAQILDTGLAMLIVTKVAFEKHLGDISFPRDWSISAKCLRVLSMPPPHLAGVNIAMNMTTNIFCASSTTLHYRSLLSSRTI